MKSQKIRNLAGKLLGILYVEEDFLKIEIVKDGCKTIIIIKDDEVVRVESFYIDRQ